MEKNTTQRWYENIVYIILIIAFAFLFIDALTTESYAVGGMASMTFPTWVFAVMLVLCIGMLTKNVVEICKEKSLGEFKKLDKRVLIMLAMIIVYAVLWEVIGFCLSSILFVTASSLLLRKNCGWVKALIVGIGSTVILYFVFGYLFKVDFPEPLLELFFG